MFSKILEHINDSQANLAWSSQRAGVVAIVPDAPAPPENIVHGPRNADG
jgi:hypothetical protein